MPGIVRPCLCTLVVLSAAAWIGWGTGGSSGGGATSVESTALNELGEAYRAYSIANKKPPKSMADLSKVEAIGGNGVASAKEGNIIVNWGATLPDTDETPGKNPSPEILAYWKGVPESGGYVLMLDRTIKQMTADEFKAAPKAGAK